MEFVINMTDDSMAPFLFTGDVVKVRSSYEAEDGHIVAALVSDEATQTTSVLIRKVALRQNTISLKPLNPTFPTLSYSGKEFSRKVCVLGIAHEMERFFWNKHTQQTPKKIILARKNRKFLENRIGSVIYEPVK